MEKLVWTVQKRKASELKAWEDNPRTIGLEEFQAIKKSILEDGDWGIISIDTDGTVINGNQRLMAFLQEAFDEIDVKVPNRPLTLQERRRIALRANRTKGVDNWDVLSGWPEEELTAGWVTVPKDYGSSSGGDGDSDSRGSGCTHCPIHCDEE